MKYLTILTVFVFLIVSAQIKGQEHLQDNKTVPDTMHVISIKGPTHNLLIDQTITLKAVSNKGYKDFKWSVEEPGIVSVSSDGEVTGLKNGVTLVIAESKKDGREGIILLSVSDRPSDEIEPFLPKTRDGERFYNKGIILYPQDNISEVQGLPKKAQEAGLNCIAVHPLGGTVNVPEVLRNWIKTPKAQQFLQECREYSIEVEYEIHAVQDFLPRELFDKDPSMFRAENGTRYQQYNLCVHSKEALQTLARNYVEFSKIFRPSTGRYYLWTDDKNVQMCSCFACEPYSNSEQALIMEMYLVKELIKIDPNATISHLSYNNTLSAPRKILPNDRVFLEYAPYHRSFIKPYYMQKDTRDGWENLLDNLKVFPSETAQVSDYWLNIGYLSNPPRKLPFTKLPWDKDIVRDDVKFYHIFGIKNITSFAGGLNAQYVRDYGFPPYKEYGSILNEIIVVD